MNTKEGLEALRTAWHKRESDRPLDGALRIFHGPSEGQGDPELSRVALELFSREGKKYAWLFTWEQEGKNALSPGSRSMFETFFREKGVAGAVLLDRPERGAPADASCFFGEIPDALDIDENGLWFRIRFLNTKHPGLFLDHRPLRDWLRTGVVRAKSVLNTFSYTGSLSVAAKAGGASSVTTLDLSRPTIAWAKENWELNFGASDPNAEDDFIYGDVFEWLPKLAKRGKRFDCIILDPPSFSRSPKKTFSTAKDLVGLHSLALRLLNPNGMLITSINSANVSHAQYRSDVLAAAKAEKRSIKEIQALSAPQRSFPGADYLKGWIFAVE